MLRNLPPKREDLANAILGVWSLISREDYSRDGERMFCPALGADPLGTLCFAPRHFAAQFMRRDRLAESGAAAASAPAPESAPASNNSVAVGGYDAYFGTYALDVAGGRITVRLEGALSPANIGQEFLREIRVEGDQLWIRLDTTAVDGTPITRTLIFEKVS